MSPVEIEDAEIDMASEEAFKAFLHSEDTAAFHDSHAYQRHLATWEAAVVWQQQQDLAAVAAWRDRGAGSAAADWIEARIKGDGE